MKKNTLLFLIFLAFLSQTINAQNAPIAIAGTIDTYGTTAVVPIKAINFTNIGSCNLKLLYDPTVVTCTAVAKGPQLFGSLSSNLTVPGVLTLGWFTYPGVTVPDSTVIFNMTFSKYATGTSAILWADDGFSCIYYDGSWNPLNDIPTASYYIAGSISFLGINAPLTIAPEITACPNSIIAVPLKINDFNNIGSLSLNLLYNSSVLIYQSFTNDAGFTGLTIDGTQAGTISAAGLIPTGGSGMTLSDNTVLFTLYFNYTGGSTGLNWNDNGSSCEYTSYPAYNSLVDSPTSTYYIDGYVHECTKLELKLYHEGLYNSSTGQMNKAKDFVGGVLVDKYTGTVADHITVELHDPGNYSTIIFQLSDVELDQDGTATVIIPDEFNVYYFITVKHRNQIETVSASSVSFAGSLISYDFTTGVTQAYGNNLKQIQIGVYALFAGDVNQDGVINILDREAINNKYLTTEQGYFSEDLNGDGIINLLDREMANNAYLQSIQTNTPN